MKSYIVLFWPFLGHIAQMPDESDAKQILAASPLENCRRPPGCPSTTWVKTTQQDLESLNLSLNEAFDVAQNHSLWRLMSMLKRLHHESPKKSC